MSNVLLNKIEEQVNKALIDCQKNGIYNFRITEDIRFYDEVWDFNAYNDSKRERFKYRFNFDNMQDMFKFGIKMVVLNRLFRKVDDFSTTQKHRSNIINFDNFCKSENVCDIRLLNVDLLKKYFEEKIKHTTNTTRNGRARTLKEILEVYDKYALYDGKVLIKYLKNFIKTHPDEKRLTSENKYIPDKLLQQIVSIAIKDLNNTNISIRDRIIAGLIIIIAETGMRVEEASIIENNRLKELGINDEKVYYLEFYTFKITPNGEERRLTKTFLTDLSLHAYRKLCELRNEIISNLSEISLLRLMIQVKDDTILKGRKKVTELRDIVNSYTEIERIEIQREIERFIFISSQTGLPKRGGGLLRHNTEEFYVRHDKDFDLSILSDSEIEEFKIFSLKSKSKYEKFFNKEERIKYPFDEIKEKTYIYINPHAFRVTVCTNLFLKKVHLDFIVKHLNHLSEDMTMYYNKSLQFEKKLEHTVEIFFQNSTDEGLIESNPDKAKEGILKEELKSEEFRENIEKINEFLQKGKFNINSDMSKIMKLLKKTNSPLMENSLGICIVSVVQKICERRKYFSSMDDNYHIGIQLETYKNINHSYKRFKQKIDVICHNKQVADRNPEYLNEYEREVNALVYYIEKTLVRELDLLEKDISNRGQKSIITEYPQLYDIINKLEEIRKEVFKWRMHTK